MLSAPPHTLQSPPAPYTHAHTLPAAIIPSCMFSWPVKSPSSQVPAHLLNLRQRANLNQGGNVLSNDELNLHANSGFQGPLGSRASGRAAMHVREAPCNAN